MSALHLKPVRRNARRIRGIKIGQFVAKAPASASQGAGALRRAGSAGLGCSGRPVTLTDGTDNGRRDKLVALGDENSASTQDHGYSSPKGNEPEEQSWGLIWDQQSLCIPSGFGE